MPPTRALRAYTSVRPAVKSSLALTLSDAKIRFFILSRTNCSINFFSSPFSAVSSGADTACTDLLETISDFIEITSDVIQTTSDVVTRKNSCGIRQIGK